MGARGREGALHWAGSMVRSDFDQMPLISRHRAPPRPLLTLLAAGALAGALPVRADPPARSAPIGGGTPGPVRQLFLDPVLADARAVGGPSFSLRLETANSWSVPTTFERDGHTVAVQLDAQADTLAFSARLPWSMALGRSAPAWSHRVATTFRWRVTGYWGGFEDSIIEGWHRLIGSYNFLRQRFPRDHINLKMTESGAAAFDLHTGRISPGDLVIGTQWLLLSGGRSRTSTAGPGEPSWGVALRLDLKAPIGSLSRLGGSGGFDAALSALATVELARWCVLHGLLYGSVLSPLSSPIALQPRRLQGGVDVSVVFLVGGWSLILEDRYLSQLMEGGWSQSSIDAISSAYAALFRPHNQITGGVRYGPLALSLSEDWTPGPNPAGKYGWFYNSNAPDLAVALTFTWPWR